ncbi:MAG TPA: hypothetical protein VGM88_29180 [Kofleriaceae bacterium]|jgi:pimeloyl-ACP methyl ester carboxylesterase
MRKLFSRVALIACVASLAACGDDNKAKSDGGTDGGSDSGPVSSIPAACNPLGGDGCLLPWPSSIYLTTDATTATGYRLVLPAAGMPKNADGAVIDPTLLGRWDGFSPTGFLLAMFPNGVSSDGLPPFSDPDQSLSADSPIVLVNMDTGERAPFFAEVDQNVTEVTRRALIIRPLARLAEKSHYAVGIRNTVKDKDGNALTPSEGFVALRDGKPYNHPLFAALQASSEAMFTALATAGVQKSDLVLAWEFRTASDAMLQGDLTTMRGAALPAMGTDGANLTFVATPQSNTAQSHARYIGTFTSPNFLTDPLAGNDAKLTRDGSGKPMMTGMRDANFAAIVPKCVETQPLPRPTIIFGHGLFGSAASYLDDDFVQSLAEDHCLIILAGDFIGLTQNDLQGVTLAINDLNRGPTVVEKLGQSIVDFMSLEHIARGPMATADEFKYNGTPVIDTTKIYYVGGSLGGIMGNAIMAYDPNLVRGVLAVPGGIWSMLIERSNAWFLLIGAAMGAYPDPSVYELNLAFLGMAFEPYDPITTAKHVIKDPLFGNPPKKILMWYSLGDCLVNNLTTEFIAREMGIPILGPAVKMPWGLPPMTGPLDNGVMIFNDHPTPLPPTTNVPPSVDNGTHSGINKKAAALRAVESFLLDPQEVVDACTVDGDQVACDCATGACD